MLRTVRLLFVDDDPDNLAVSAIILREKYSVVTCRSAAEAVEAGTRVEPDVVMIDIGMSPIDSVQCLHAIRALPGYARIPAIAWTAFAREVEREEFIKAGFQTVVTKPLADYPRLEAIIDALVEPCAAAAGAIS